MHKSARGAARAGRDHRDRRDNHVVAETNAEKARRGFEAALRGDLAALGAILDADVKWHGGDPSGPGACHSRPEALAFMRKSDVIRGGRFELVDVVAVGDKVVVSMRPPSDSGDPLPPVANLITFRDGKVVEMVHYPDANDALCRGGRERRAVSGSVVSN